jgi:transcriptional regulator with XRE-family HTH domain
LRIVKKNKDIPTVRNIRSGQRNLMRVLRRRLGLTQRELAFLLGRAHVDISYFENGVRLPHLADALMIELVFGVPAVTIFPEIRDAVGDRVRRRAKRLLSEIQNSSADIRRVSYKSAQLENVVASLRTPDVIDQSDDDA